jgi:hypothetical protein
MGAKVNNWEAAQELQRFKQMYIDDLKKAIEDPKNDKHRDVLEGKLINFSRIHSSMLKLIAQHEDLVDELAEIYQKWFTDVSINGDQPAEMMQIQAEILQDLFVKLYNILKPLGLSIGKPDGIS